MNNPFDTVNLKEEKKIHDSKIDMNNHICHDKIKNVPDEMKNHKQWLYANATNAPSNNKGYPVPSNKSENHMSFEDMINNNNNKLYYCYRLQGDFMIVDLDKCFDEDGKLYNFAKEALDQLIPLNPYIEYSKSHKGLHVILESTKRFDNMKTLCIKLKSKHEKYSHLPVKSGIDIMNSKHCITLTGDIYQSHNPKKIGTTNNEFLNKFYKPLLELNKKDAKSAKDRLNKKIGNGSVEYGDIFDVINTSVDIVDVLSMYGYEWNSQHINCPFPEHEDSTPSFYIHETTNTYCCYGCNKAGDVTDLVARLNQVTNLQAAKDINNKFDLELDFSVLNQIEDYPWVVEDSEGKIMIDQQALVNHLDEEHYIKFTEQDIYMYSDGTYKKENKNVIKKLIMSHMPGIYNNLYKQPRFINAVFEALEWNFKSFNEFNTNNMIVNFKNTSCQFKHDGDYEFIETSPTNLNTFQIPFNYVEDNTCNVWDKFIKETLPEDQIILLQEMMGYALINNNSAKKFFGFYGKGDTGKSVVLDTIVRLVGQENSSAVPLQKLANSSDKFATSSLLGKFVNVCGDLSSKFIDDVSLIKSLTSGIDKMSFEKKGKDAIDTYNTARMYFSMNVLPKVGENSKEFFNRFIMIPFENIVSEDKQDKNLINKFNLEGVATWAFEGLKRLIKNNFVFSEFKENKDLMEHYVTTDSPVVDFIKSAIEFTDNNKDEIIKKDLFDAFKYFAENVRNDHYATKMKGNRVIEEFLNNTNLKMSKKCKNPSTQRMTAQGFKGVRFKDDFMAEFKNHMKTNNIFNNK